MLNCKKEITPYSVKGDKDLPSKIIDLNNWGITIPFDEVLEDSSESSDTKEITGDLFMTYNLANYYFVKKAGDDKRRESKMAV